jgi:hypothetical protein
MQLNLNNMSIDNATHDRRHPVVVGMAERCVEAAGARDRPKTARTGRSRPAKDGRNTPETPEPVRRRALGAHDFALMAVLGIVHEGFTRFAEIVPAAKSLAGLDWQPTGDVLAGALENALADGLLIVTEAGYALADEGRLRLAELVQASPATERGGTGRTAAALKVCFLGALDGRRCWMVARAVRHPAFARACGSPAKLSACAARSSGSARSGPNFGRPGDSLDSLWQDSILVRQAGPTRCGRKHDQSIRWPVPRYRHQRGRPARDRWRHLSGCRDQGDRPPG